MLQLLKQYLSGLHAMITVDGSYSLVIQYTYLMYLGSQFGELTIVESTYPLTSDGVRFIFCTFDD